MVPQYALIGGIRFDYERRLGNGDWWLLVAPQFYNDKYNTDYYYYSYYPSNNPYAYYDEMRGYGGNLYIKWNFKKSTRIDRLSGQPASLLYVALGPTLQHYMLSRYEEVTVAYEEDGTTYYRFEYQENKYTLTRYGGNINMGVQFAMRPFLVDLYWGLGYKIGFDQDGEKAHNGVMIDPFYSGMIFDAGFKFGFYF